MVMNHQVMHPHAQLYSCLLDDAGDPESPWRWTYGGNQLDVVDDPMSSLEDIDKNILASLILNVDVTEVFSPTRINKLAATFGLIPVFFCRI